MTCTNEKIYVGNPLDEIPEGHHESCPHALHFASLSGTLHRDVPIDEWRFGPDHWSTLLYINTVAVDRGGFKIDSDPRMRTYFRTYEAMDREDAKEHPNVRPFTEEAYFTPVYQADGTKTKVFDHDDWSCLYDMMLAGYFVDMTPFTFKVGAVLQFSPKGQEMVARLEQHKRTGGTFKNFKLPPPEAT